MNNGYTIKYLCTLTILDVTFVKGPQALNCEMLTD